MSPNEIKVIVPITTSGTLTLSINGISTGGPAYTYMSPLSSPYSTGNVVLTSQADVDAFVNQNSGRQLQITGSLTVSGNDISSTKDLSNITAVAQNLTVSGMLMNELSFLSKITSVGGNIILTDLPASAIAMSNLAGAVTSLTVSSCKNLRSASFSSLKTINGGSYTAGLLISGCDVLEDMDFSSLKSVSHKLSVTGSAVRDFSGFGSLQSAGSIAVAYNQYLNNFKGLENLTSLTSSALSQVSPSSSATLNGLGISSNIKLTSLYGLQNLSTVPVARINGNPMLVDFCPFKVLLSRLSGTADYVYTKQSLNSIGSTKVSVKALLMTNNGSYVSTENALAALAFCK